MLGRSVTLHSSALGQVPENLYTVFERGQIAHEDPTIFIKLLIDDKLLN